MVVMMDTLAIYEQFRAVLGEERAKGFAQSLGTMIEEAKNAATKDDIRLLREAIDGSASRLDAALAKLAEAQARAEARGDRLEEAVSKLAEAQARTEARVGRLEEAVSKLAEAQARTEARVDRLEEAVSKLAEAQARTEARVDRLEEAVSKLAEAQARTEAQVRELAAAQTQSESRLSRLEEAVQRLTQVVERLVVRSDRHEGTLLELRFRDRLPSYLGLFLRRAKVLQPADLLDDLEPRLERSEIEDFLRADVLARGAVNGEATYVVGEVSFTAHASDIDRAARRAGLLRKAKLPSVGLVACETVQPETLAYAREKGVRVWADGRFVDEQSNVGS